MLIKKKKKKLELIKLTRQTSDIGQKNEITT
jgi:hypothetical protein